MKQILFATDFSENSLAAFPFAMKLADKHRAEITVLHVYSVPTLLKYPHAGSAEEMTREALHESETKMKTLRNRFNVKGKVSFIAEENNAAAKGILSVVAENIPDILVVGTRGESKSSKIIMGSTTNALVKRSPAPVLAIPENCSASDFKEVLFTTDFHETDILAIRRLIGLLGPFEPNLEVIHFSDRSEVDGADKMAWFKELLNKRVAYRQIDFQLLRANHVAKKLLSYTKENQFDLLVMLEKKHHRFVDLLFGDVVEKVQFRTSIPLLTFNEYFLQLLDETAHGYATQNELLN